MNRLARTALAAAGPAAFLAIWEVLPRIGLLNQALVPPPSAIPAPLAREVTSGIWLQAVRSSLTHYTQGLAVGAGLGVLLGIFAGMSTVFESATAWIVRVVRPIPGLAWVP